MLMSVVKVMVGSRWLVVNRCWFCWLRRFVRMRFGVKVINVGIFFVRKLR